MAYEETKFITPGTGIMFSPTTTTVDNIPDGTPNQVLAMNSSGTGYTFQNPVIPGTYQVVADIPARDALGTLQDGSIVLVQSVPPLTNVSYVQIGGTWYDINLQLSIDFLTDVVITSPVTGESLVWDGSNWVNQTVSVPVQIPTPMFSIPPQGEPFMKAALITGSSNNTNWNLNVYHAPIQDDRFLAYNPVIELVRYKRRHSCRKGPSGYVRRDKNLPVHPTHFNGVGSTGKAYNGGSQRDHAGNLMPDRTTEWAYNPTYPFEKTNIVFNIAEWKGIGTNLASGAGSYPFPEQIDKFEDFANDYYRSTGTGKSKTHKTEVFAFRIRIDNPDIATQPNKPYIYGEPSDKFKVYPKIGNDGNAQILYGWKISRAHYQKNRS